MGLFKSIGRFVGKLASTAGKITGNSTLERWGDNIQYACRETSQRTGTTGKYDKDTASADQTAYMADILAGFSSGLQGQGRTIEQTARNDIEAYFDQLYAALVSVLGEGALKTLNLQKQMVLSSIEGAFNAVLTRRVSLTDSECLKILGMPQGSEKEKEMEAFGAKVINEGIEKLCTNIQNSVKTIREEMAAELSDMVDKRRCALEEYAAKAREISEKRQSDIENNETEIFLPSKKLAAAELLLGLVQNGGWK